MIVKYVRDRGYKGKDKDPYLTFEKLYIVHAISFQPQDYNPLIAILCDEDDDPALFELKYFDIIDDRIPVDWVFYASKIDYNASPQEFSYYNIFPQEFSGDLWEKYHDGDEDAEEIFEQVVHKLRVFHGWGPKPKFNLENFDQHRVAFLLDELERIFIEKEGINFAQGKAIREMLRFSRYGSSSKEYVDAVRDFYKQMLEGMNDNNIDDSQRKIMNEIWDYLDCDLNFLSNVEK